MIITSKNIENINMTILSIKIVFTTIFFNTTAEFVVGKLKEIKIEEIFRNFRCS
jgi:hypothetical protein